MVFTENIFAVQFIVKLKRIIRRVNFDNIIYYTKSLIE